MLSPARSRRCHWHFSGTGTPIATAWSASAAPTARSARRPDSAGPARTITGPATAFRRIADSGSSISFPYCPACGSTVSYLPEAEPDVVALTLGEPLGALYLDLESERDRAKLAEPELYLADHLGRLVILDEIHRAPGLFPVLRGMIDRSCREGKGHGLYLLLGSASLDLLKQSGETLAGRVSYLELDPLDVLEVGLETAERDRLWLRGGFPDSFLASSDARSLRWRQDFIRSYLERDIHQFGRRIAAETLRRFWTMLAHHQGGVLNVAQLARNLGVDVKTAAAYIDLLVDLLLMRRLPSWQANVGKRLVKSPKVYVRDSGLVHALLALGDKEMLLSHPVVGASWEGFIVEQLLAVAPEGVQGFFLLPDQRRSRGRPPAPLSRWPELSDRDQAQPRTTPAKGLSLRLRRPRSGATIRCLSRRRQLPAWGRHPGRVAASARAYAGGPPGSVRREGWRELPSLEFRKCQSVGLGSGDVRTRLASSRASEQRERVEGSPEASGRAMG